ncbi:MAG TPA: serine hydrolase [Mycobacteriales bacterium]|nr:serine hydrolase [Mycobacteriales bacterium]
MARLQHLPPTKPFRHTWQYNNLLYLVAGHLAGRLHGGTYEDAVRDRILTPLGMAQTCFDVSTVRSGDDWAVPYVRPIGQEQLKAVPHAPLSLAGPAGNINTSAADLVSWLRTLLGLGVDDRPPLLSASVLSELRTPTMPQPPSPAPGPARAVGYGLGLTIEDYRGKRLSHHGGNVDGFSSQVLCAPDQGTAVAVLTNLHTTALRDALPYLILDLIDGIADAPDHGATLIAQLQAVLGGMKQAQRAQSVRSNGLPAVRPLSDYVGTYRHPGYGEITVTEGEDGLALTYYELCGPLEHRHLEVFSASLTMSGDDLRVPVQATHDLEGYVDALLVQMEPALPPLRFARTASTEHLTDALLDDIAGTYTSGPLTAVVARKDARSLTLALNGQAPAELRPVAGRVFALGPHHLEFAGDGTVQTPFGLLSKQR